MAAWDRQPKEPPKAYQHFCTFRDLGPTRSLEETAKIQGIAKTTALDLSSRFNWAGRVDQWDAHVRRLSDRAFLNEAQKKARARAQAYTRLLIRSDEALKLLDFSKRPPTLGQIAAAMKIACEGMRLEDGLETQRVVHEVYDVRLVIAALPAPVRTEVLRLLEEHAESGGSGGVGGDVPALAAGSPID